MIYITYNAVNRLYKQSIECVISVETLTCDEAARGRTAR